jgi:hypothetical protein
VFRLAYTNDTTSGQANPNEINNICNKAKRAATLGSELIDLPDAPLMMQIECAYDFVNTVKGFLEEREKRRR